MGFFERLQHGWNAFMNRDPTSLQWNIGESYSRRPDRPRFVRGERTVYRNVRI